MEQHQCVSSSSIPSLTRKDEECLLTSPSLDALQRVKGSGWAPNSGSTIPGLQFSETGSSDVPLRSGEQIQPDNALSHTTVTLSYVSRSHVFATHNSPLYSVSPISRFSLHTHCNTDRRLGETSYALSQHYPKHEEPTNLITQGDAFPLFSQPRVGPDGDAREYDEPPEFNRGARSSDECPEKRPLEGEDHSVIPENGKYLENGCRDGWSNSSSEIQREDERGASDVVFIEAKNQDKVVSDSGAAADLCSVRREYKSPLEDPVSPHSTSLDEMEDTFLLPQASSSPSGDGFYLECADDAVRDTLSTDGTARENSVVSDCPTSSDTSSKKDRLSHRRKAVLEPLIDLADDACELDDPEYGTGSAVVPRVNEKPNVLERTFNKRKLPNRSGRGTLLEAIVMNINSSCYKVSGCILANKQPSASQTAAREPSFAHSERTPPSHRRRAKAKSALSRRTNKRKDVKGEMGKPSDVESESCNDSTSVSDLINKTEVSDGSSPAKTARFARMSRKPTSSSTKPTRKRPSQPNGQSPAHKTSKKPEVLPETEPSVDMNASKTLPGRSPPKSPKNNLGCPKNKSRSKASSAKKTTASRVPKRRRKKPKRSQPSSMFSPKEPEIKLRYVNYKEEKKDLRLDSFSPSVRLNRRQLSPALCTIINYPEEVKAEPKQRRQDPSSRFVSAVVPSTSCLKKGRPSKHGQQRRALVCCLCGRPANSIDLGDLHGPYYPEGYRPNTKAPASALGLKGDEEESSDSDSSSITRRARPWPCNPGAQGKQNGVLGSRKWASGRISGPPAKRPQLDGGFGDVEDWYSPPVLPVEPCEYWLHEDCGVWSAGVFLVKGKVYGLEEAVKIAQETMCSACHNPGATLGCFFKACPNKYHYRCALESDCVLVEENFSMKCKKHKNKTLKAPPGSRRDDR